jgi:hypothetical protein
VATHQGRALAPPGLLGLDLFAELERYIRVENPGLENITVTSATPTDDWHKGLLMKWYRVGYTADD